MGELKFDMPKAKAILNRMRGGIKTPPETNSEELGLMMPAAIERIESLEACLIENKKRWAAWMDTTDQQIIDKLRDRLCESEAISLHNFQRYEAMLPDGGHSCMDREQAKLSWDDLPEEQRKAIIEVHREMLKCEGKI
jgi:hypothetical protein